MRYEFSGWVGDGVGDDLVGYCFSDRASVVCAALVDFCDL